MTKTAPRPTAMQKLQAVAILSGAIEGPNRQTDVEIGRALGWRVSHDGWWNHRGQDERGRPIYDPPGDGWCIRRDRRKDLPCNEALPQFTFMPRQDALEVIEDA
jgi:hypothetical protein